MTKGGTVHPTNIERVNYGRQLGALLTFQRTKRKLSQTAAARKVGIKIETLRSIEQGDRIPTKRERERIAKAYNFDVANIPKMMVDYAAMSPEEFERIRDISGLEAAVVERHRRIDSLAMRRIQRQFEEQDAEEWPETFDVVLVHDEDCEDPPMLTTLAMVPVEHTAPQLEDLLDPDFALDLRLAAMLRKRRQDLNLRIEDVAITLLESEGWDEQDLTRFERDLSGMRVSVLQTLCAVYGLPEDEVLVRAGIIPADIIRYFRYHPETIQELRGRVA